MSLLRGYDNPKGFLSGPLKIIEHKKTRVSFNLQSRALLRWQNTLLQYCFSLDYLTASPAFK